VPVPSQQDIEAAILKRKKQELIDKYASDSMMED
jgi:pre-mRNA-splicing factor ISY1